LERRKRELYGALRLLDRDHEDGAMDAEAYRIGRTRLEAEAAGILERLDTLPDAPQTTNSAARRPRPWLVPAGVAVGLAILIFVAAAVHARGTNQSITGDVPTAAPAVGPQLASALRVARAHPRSAVDQIALGNAYLNRGDTARADQSYVTAMRLAPNRPEAPTLHSMILAGDGSRAQALLLLRGVEHAHPTYARAWLLDGLISSRTPRGARRAIADWRTFLRLQPHSAVSTNVRRWMAGLEKKAAS
jgi:cytochrome c-type biogenesis protein CcmH/NrfG